jgi:hypothetical protein
MEKRKKVRERDNGHMTPRTLYLSSDGEDNQIEVSQETEDLENNEEEKHEASTSKVSLKF